MGVPPADAVLTAYARSFIQFKARQIGRKPGFNPSDEEDLVQELTTFLIRQAGKYDPRRGASVETFANRVILSGVRMILRDRRRAKRAAGFAARSVERSTVDAGGTQVPLVDVVSDQDRARVTGV